MNGALSDVQAVFGRAVELESPVERSAYLDEACGRDTSFRDEVESLLEAFDSAGDFMTGPAATASGPASAAVVAEGPGTCIGPYELLERIGEGGMGVVFLAKQRLPVHRKVALKILKPGLDTQHVVARFEGERQVLAL